MNLFNKKTFESVRALSASSTLTKTLNAFDLILIGLGAIVGAGVFVLTGSIAANYSGPAVMISYIIPGIICIFVALAYSELAVMLPTSGSVYTYAYVAFGEIFAWMTVSLLLLELTFGASAVSVSWGAYVMPIVEMAGFHMPKYLTTVPSEGGIMNLPAVIIVAFVTLILYLGTKDSKKLNAILVFIKLGAILAFVIAAAPNFDSKNWEPFMPNGIDDVLIGASVLFFAFNGFSIIPTAAEECKNPKRDITIGIIGALTATTFIYVLIGGLLTGIVSYKELNNAQPLAHALLLNNNKIGSLIVAVGAICGMTTVLMMNLYGTSRIAYAIARDGLLPKSFSNVHAKYDTPYIALFAVAGLTAALGAFVPYMQLAQLTSMGALIDYILVVSIMVVFRITRPNVLRTFKCPAIYLVAPIAIISCLYLLSKQVFDKSGALSTPGFYLLCWIGFITLLYFPIKFATGKK